MSCVLTLALDDASQVFFEDQRQTWYPPELNRIPAHLSLFHTLPEDETTERILAASAAETASFALQTGAPRPIGRGVAYFFSSTEAAALHARLRRAFESDLTQQDRQGFRPHVVVQNKVTRDAAQAALLALGGKRAPERVTAIGLDLWRYLGGPWKLLQRFPFSV